MTYLIHSIHIINYVSHVIIFFFLQHFWRGPFFVVEDSDGALRKGQTWTAGPGAVDENQKRR